MPLLALCVTGICTRLPAAVAALQSQKRQVQSKVSALNLYDPTLPNPYPPPGKPQLS